MTDLAAPIAPSAAQDSDAAIHDVVIIGAGLSGIGAACHLRRECPRHSVLILEARERMGGTWDLFRYPGIRSDSDMHTLGYDFKPWIHRDAIADRESILDYVRETAREHDIEGLIRYRRRVQGADWDSVTQRWTLQLADDTGAPAGSVQARFILSCSGYYRYDRGYLPEYPGRGDFRGTFVHPQRWPDNLDYSGKRVVVIGSGATAMTLVPAMAEKAAQVTMLQRSPTWVISRPSRDRLGNLLRRVLPGKLAYRITRAKNVCLQHVFYRRTRVNPGRIRRLLLRGVRNQLERGAAMADFTPTYDPWDQRLCLLPDGDLFAALNAGRANVVTAEIERLTANGVRLVDGRELAADIIVSATGLELLFMGGVNYTVDGEPFSLPESVMYRGIMCTGLPNVVTVFGYLNASWTLRADMVARWFCHLLRHMDARGSGAVVPRLRPGDADMPLRPWVEGYSSGYLRRGLAQFPRQGDREPWRNAQLFLRERREFAAADLDDAALAYTPRVACPQGAAATGSE